jgi:hypothetical protein
MRDDFYDDDDNDDRYALLLSAVPMFEDVNPSLKMTIIIVRIILL